MSRPATAEEYLEALRSLYQDQGYLLIASWERREIGSVRSSKDFSEESVRNENMRFRIVGMATKEEYATQNRLLSGTELDGWEGEYTYKVEVLD